MTQFAVYKYTLNHWHTELQLPCGSIPLSAGQQGDTFQLWCKVPVVPGHMAQATRKFVFLLVPTGSPFPTAPDTTFIDTIQCNDGTVFHVFEVN